MGCAEIYDGAEGSWVILTVLWTPDDRRRRQHLKQKSNSDSIRIWRWFSIGNSLHGRNGNRNRIGTAITNLSFWLDHSRERSPGTVSNLVRKICRSCHHWYLRWERDCSRSRSSLDQCSTKKSMNSTLSQQQHQLHTRLSPSKKVGKWKSHVIADYQFLSRSLDNVWCIFGSFELVWRCAVGQFANTRARFLHPEASTKWNRARHTYIGQVYISSMNFFFIFSSSLIFFSLFVVFPTSCYCKILTLGCWNSRNCSDQNSIECAQQRQRAARFACSQK